MKRTKRQQQINGHNDKKKISKGNIMAKMKIEIKKKHFLPALICELRKFSTKINEFYQHDREKKTNSFDNKIVTTL